VRPSGRRRAIFAVVAFVVVLLLAEAALVATVFVSPGAGDRIRGAVARVDRAWSGTTGAPGLKTRIARAVDDQYRSWIESMWKPPSTPVSDAKFSGCVKCHKDYAQARRFPSVYMNHPLHAQIGVACATCHESTAHPNPPLPTEKTCATCHAEVQQRDGCGTCHPPASLPHFYLLGAPRNGVVECSVCHPKDSFTSHATTPLVPNPNLYGTDPSTCRQCHQEQTCSSCHATPHPADWVHTHGQLVSQGGQVDCYSCHVQTWCADRCHAVTNGTTPPPRPLPSIGVRP
jgi:ABC-type cobalt transport system substrate-binding protein